MSTCKDCIYYEVCKALNKEFKIHPKDYIETDLCAKQCTTFKDKSKFIELPCKVGDTVYIHFYNREKAKYEVTPIKNIQLSELAVLIEDNEKVYLSDEQAEQALKECEKK